MDIAFQKWNNPKMFELADLKAFYKVAELGTLSGAAREMQIPKSSLSRSLERLERETGSRLFERSTRSLRLTEAGSLLLPHARRILDDVFEAENSMGSLLKKPQGTLRVSVPFTYAGGPLTKMLPKFLSQYHLKNGSLMRVLPNFKWPTSLDVHAIYPSHRSLSAKVRVFIDCLVENPKQN